MTRRLKQSWLAVGLVLILSLALASCTVVGPDYQAPAVTMPATFKSATTQESAATMHLGRDWWRLFGDRQLDELERAALAASPSLQAAMARVLEARASTRAVKSQFYPVITANPSVARARTITGASGGDTTNTLTQVPFDLSYEVDLWGRIRRSVEASESQTQATVTDLEVVRQTLVADVAQNDFNLRSFDTQDQIIARNVTLYRKQLDLTQTLLKVGIVSPTDVLQAKALLDATLAQQIDVRRQRADTEHALAILLGRPPAELTLDVRPLDLTPPAIPAGLAADLLRRRPDVAEAEQSLTAANAQIGVAQANFYPVLKLTGMAGFESLDVAHTFDWQSRVWSLGPSLTVPIFEGGQLEANLELAKARYQELVANYRSAVLGAFRDVEDALTDLHLHADQNDALDRAVASSREYLRLTEIQYQKGVASYLQVIDADRTLLANELAAAAVLNQRLVASVLLMKALGGGWDPAAAATQP